MGVNKVNIEKHPISVYLNYLRKLVPDEDAYLNFKSYTYQKKSFNDECKEHITPLKMVDISWLENVSNSLMWNEELAITSIIDSGNGRFFIPMIDLSIKDLVRASSAPSINKFISYWDMDFFVFNSGRSFHLYGNKLFSSDRLWIKFMSSLLLLNEPGQQQIIDSRWVGHRLMAGYSALRLTNKTNQYKRYPIFVGMLTEYI